MNLYMHPLFLYLLFTLLSFLFIVFEYSNYAFSLRLHGENTVHSFFFKKKYYKFWDLQSFAIFNL